MRLTLRSVLLTLRVRMLRVRTSRCTWPGRFCLTRSVRSTVCRLTRSVRSTPPALTRSVRSTIPVLTRSVRSTVIPETPSPRTFAKSAPPSNSRRAVGSGGRGCPGRSKGRIPRRPAKGRRGKQDNDIPLPPSTPTIIPRRARPSNPGIFWVRFRDCGLKTGFLTPNWGVA